MASVFLCGRKTRGLKKRQTDLGVSCFWDTLVKVGVKGNQTEAAILRTPNCLESTCAHHRQWRKTLFTLATNRMPDLRSEVDRCFCSSAGQSPILVSGRLRLT